MLEHNDKHWMQLDEVHKIHSLTIATLYSKASEWFGAFCVATVFAITAAIYLTLWKPALGVFLIISTFINIFIIYKLFQRDLIRLCEYRKCNVPTEEVVQFINTQIEIEELIRGSHEENSSL